MIDVVDEVMHVVYRVCIKLGISTPRQLRKFGFYYLRHTLYCKKLFSMKGTCSSGECAKLVCCKACEWLEKKGNKWVCSNWENRPQGCRLFPVNERELGIINSRLEKHGLVCGYYWGEKK